MKTSSCLFVLLPAACLSGACSKSYLIPASPRSAANSTMAYYTGQHPGVSGNIKAANLIKPILGPYPGGGAGRDVDLLSSNASNKIPSVHIR